MAVQIMGKIYLWCYRKKQFPQLPNSLQTYLLTFSPTLLKSDQCIHLATDSKNWVLMFCLIPHSRFSSSPPSIQASSWFNHVIRCVLLSLLFYARCLRYLCHSDINWKKLELEFLSITETPKLIICYTYWLLHFSKCRFLSKFIIQLTSH